MNWRGLFQELYHMLEKEKCICNCPLSVYFLFYRLFEQSLNFSTYLGKSLHLYNLCRLYKHAGLTSALSHILIILTDISSWPWAFLCQEPLQFSIYHFWITIKEGILDWGKNSTVLCKELSFSMGLQLLVRYSF